jgi:hypothetical protein
LNNKITNILIVLNCLFFIFFYFLKLSYYIMPKKSRRHSRSSKRRSKSRTSKNIPIVMVGCSKKGKKCNISSCPNCGPNCHCGPKCKCSHPCPGNCYLNHRLKGGSGCGSCGCPIAPLKMSQFGGAIPPIPGPNVGSAWGPSINKLPGGNGISGDRNYLAPVDVTKNPQQQQILNDTGYNNMNSFIGGYKSRKNRYRFKKGGGLIPQDLVNLGRDFTFNLGSAYNALNGYKAPINPLPYKGQLTGSLNNKILF